MRKKNSTAKKARELTYIDCSHPGGKVHPTLQRYFGYCLYKSAMRFRSLLDGAIAKYGLLTPQLGILRVVHESGSLSQQDIGDYMGIDKASMVKFIDQLEKAGLLVRKSHKSDRRVKLAVVTPKGEKILEEVAKIRHGIEAQFLEPLTDEESEQIRKIIPKLLR